MSNNIWHKSTQEPRGECRIYYINCWNNVQRYSIDDMREEQQFNPSTKWEDVVNTAPSLDGHTKRVFYNQHLIIQDD